MNVLVVDVGTSSMRGILYAQDGKLLAQAQTLYSATYLGNSWVEQDVSDWENALYRNVKDVITVAEENGWSIDAISLTSQRSSVIPVDKEIHPLQNAIMWQDKRTNEICERLAPQNDRMFALCGSRVNPVFSASKMTWIRENQPEIYAKTYKYMVIPDYLLYLMTGRLCTDDTYGSRTLLMNIYTHEWDDELLEMFNIDKSKLCELVPAGSICGKVTKEFAELTGCPQGTPVVTAGGDQQCGAIGQGVVKPGVLSVTAGTGGFLITATDSVPAHLESDVICNTSSIQGQYVLESSVLTCCSAFDWFRRTFYGADVGFPELNAAIASVPIGSNGVLCLPYFQGRSTPDWNNLAKGVFANVTLATTKADMLRSLLEAICYEIGNGIDVMQKYVDITDIYVNGGLTNSEAFNEIQCNVYGTKIIRRGKSDATARGALMVGEHAIGAYDTVEDAFKEISRNDDVTVELPNQEETEQYEKHKAQMNRLYKKLWSAQLVDGQYQFSL